MSADMFSATPTTTSSMNGLTKDSKATESSEESINNSLNPKESKESRESRIPTPVLQRSHSLRRLRTASTGSSAGADLQCGVAARTNGSEQVDNGGGAALGTAFASPSQPSRRRHDAAGLTRGNSFMERGEQRRRPLHGDGVAGGVASTRPKHLTYVNNRAGGTSPCSTPMSQSARTRSLSLSQSSSRLNSPRSPHPAAPLAASPRTPPTSPSDESRPKNGTLGHPGDAWETDSMTSITSLASVGSCDHASIARNGTTFSGRSMKYVFHCNQHSGEAEDYLTPTQRVHRQVQKLKVLLHQAKKELEDKDSDILKLTREVVELRLCKAALGSPEDKSNSSECVTVKELCTDEQSTPGGDTMDLSRAMDMSSSYTDSGHFDDYSHQSPTATTTKKHLNIPPTKTDKATNVSLDIIRTSTPVKEQHHTTDLILEYEKRLQELVKTHEDESHQLKQKHNDKVEELLQRITEINKRYWELVPELDSAKERIRELETQLEAACKKLEQQEDKQKKTYLEMYNQGHEAATLEREARVMEMVRQGPSRISVPELLEELQVTKNELENIKDVEYASSTSNSSQSLLSAKEALSLWVLGARKAMYRQLMEVKNKNKIDPEITLQFLKSAVYYFLTDQENSQGHLKAIQSILGFTANEINNIDKAWPS